MSDIRKWFMKQHDKKKDGGSPAAAAKPDTKPPPPPPAAEKPEEGGRQRRKTSKFFAGDEGSKDEKVPAKRKTPQKEVESVRPTSAKKVRKDEDEDEDDFEPSSEKRKAVEARPLKKLKKEVEDVDGGRDEDDGAEQNDVDTPSKSAGRGRGGRGPGAAAGGRGRGGGGRSGFGNFGERKEPPRKGEKEVPEGAPNCLAGLTFVLTGTLDSLEREEAEDLIKHHGGRVTGSVSKKTNYLLTDEDIGGNKSKKAMELGTTFLTEDGLFDMIRKSVPAKTPVKEGLDKKFEERKDKSKLNSSPMKIVSKDDQAGPLSRKSTVKSAQPSASPSKKKVQVGDDSSLTWTQKYRPKVPNEIIGNQSIVKQLHDWLVHWHEQISPTGQKGKGGKRNDSGSKKAVLLCGNPGIGKSTSAKLISQMLGFKTIEVNASDSRGKADNKISKGIGGSTSNSIKELCGIGVLNTSKNGSKFPKTVLIMDEVDGMSAGDRGGVADLIDSIKKTKIPIICICNDRYSQKLKSLMNYCMPLIFRKPTKQQMAKRLKEIADAEGLKVDNPMALEELAERVNGDMRMAINQLQYMSLTHSVLEYDDIRQHLLSSAKDEDISPFTAVDKLLGYNGGKLRMDERIDLSMSDPDLIPLIIQENYINYRPASIAKDENGLKRLNLLACAAESIGDGDIFNVQIRRYRQWQLYQAGSFASSIIPAALMHGGREIFVQGERNFNRFGGWLGKNSTMGKNLRLLEDAHVHILSSQGSIFDRTTLRTDYFPLLLKELTEPLRVMPKNDAVQKVVQLMNDYSLSQEDFDMVVELSKFQTQPNPLEGVVPAVKSALTSAYKAASQTRVVRAADLVNLPGLKKAPKKRIAAMLEPVDPVDSNLPQENGGALLESEDEDSDSEETDGVNIGGEAKPKLELQSDGSKGIQVQLDLKDDGKSNGKKTPASKGRGGASAARGGRGAARGGKRKR